MSPLRVHAWEQVRIIDNKYSRSSSRLSLLWQYCRRIVRVSHSGQTNPWVSFRVLQTIGRESIKEAKSGTSPRTCSRKQAGLIPSPLNDRRSRAALAPCGAFLVALLAPFLSTLDPHSSPSSRASVPQCGTPVEVASCRSRTDYLS